MADTRQGRRDQSGRKVACRKCRIGHRTKACVDNQDHQEDVQPIPSAGRPKGARTSPIRAAERRELKKQRQKQRELKEEAAFHQQQPEEFLRQRANPEPHHIQGNFAAQAAGFQQFPNVTGAQQFGGLFSQQGSGAFIPPQSALPAPGFAAPSLVQTSFSRGPVAQQPTQVSQALANGGFAGRSAINPSAFRSGPSVAGPFSPYQQFQNDWGVQNPTAPFSSPVPAFPAAPPIQDTQFPPGLFGTSNPMDIYTSSGFDFPLPSIPHLAPAFPNTQTWEEYLPPAGQHNAFNPVFDNSSAQVAQVRMEGQSGQVGDGWLIEAIAQEQKEVQRAAGVDVSPEPAQSATNPVVPGERVEEGVEDQVIPEQVSQSIPATNSHSSPSTTPSSSGTPGDQVHHSPSSVLPSLEAPPIISPGESGEQSDGESPASFDQMSSSDPPSLGPKTPDTCEAQCAEENQSGTSQKISKIPIEIIKHVLHSAPDPNNIPFLDNHYSAAQLIREFGQGGHSERELALSFFDP
ncbi:hypothetical protein FBEOM_3567 [Fusarium beomiforme]|uniref:Copper-fist domain-containing protein n=1 Tax=Fusarium beomiforme TaxID=44412 RepID=A0A9P5APR9_9HYPO|nr:hypothetical protein FBEOM_3567 [Fusarium beomiforme]